MVTSADTGQARHFERDGYLSGVRVCEPAEADRIRRQFDALEAAEGREKCQKGLLDRHFDERFVWEVATHPPIVEAVAAVLGPDVMLLFSHFFCKYPEVRGEGSGVRGEEKSSAVPHPSPLTPGPEKFVAWHQDVTYWGLEPPAAVTVWYAVDDSDVENGCMRVIPGTHRAGVREHGKSARAGNLLSINQEVPIDASEEARAVDLELRAGEISLHHGLLIHGSNPNRSHRRRCGLALRYIPPSVRQVEASSLGYPLAPVLVRGADRYHHFGDRARPFG